jgi:hypothetical protein
MMRAAGVLCLSCACVCCIAQAPPDAEIEQVRANALDYTRELPNFLCREIVNRYYDPQQSSNWSFLDTVTAQLTYFEGREQYAQIRVNEKLVPESALTGVMSEGEFGSLLRDIFEPGHQARFDRERETKVHGRAAFVLKYDVDKEHSHYRLSAENNQEYVTAYKGRIFVDDETKRVLRVEMSPYGIPATFPVHAVNTTVDYEFTNVGGKKYLLPVKAEIVSEHHSVTTRNTEEFRQYRKFSAEANLSFDAPDAKPD